MTTKHSPLAALKAQADQIATLLKAAERGDNIPSMAQARSQPSFTFGVVMDDKVLRIEMTWEKVRDTEWVALSEYIVLQMQEKRSDG